VDLVRLRNTHPAFDGEMCVEAITDTALRVRWQHAEGDLLLDVDFAAARANVTEGGRRREIAAWQPVEAAVPNSFGP
jgi:hypothetical protein